MDSNSFKKNVGTCILLIAAILIVAGCSMTKASSFKNSPPGSPYKMVSQLVELPEYIPGLGTLYVDPATLPAGPFLGYDRNGNLSHITYMIPLSAMGKNKNFIGLGTSVDGLHVNHTDISYNPGHPGVAEPHYHFTLWLIDEIDKTKM